jgi:hypothetical protein
VDVAEDLIWQGSTPLQLTLNLKFLDTDSTFVRGGREEFLGADKSGFIEVYQPTCQPMSLIYPGGDGENITHFVPPGHSAFHAFSGKDAMVGQQGKLDVVGHPVDVQVGNFILFQNCFIINCQVKYSPTLDASGYPMSATAALTIESFEYPFVDLQAASAIQSGSGFLKDAIAPPFTLFMLNQQTNDMVQGMVNTLVDMANIFETTVRAGLDFFGIDKSKIELAYNSAYDKAKAAYDKAKSAYDTAKSAYDKVTKWVRK